MGKATYNLANLYYHGTKVPKDLPRASQLYHEAALKGHSEAQFTYAYMLEHGLGLPVDIRKAKQWYKEAAINAHKKARRNLSLLLKKEGNMEESHFWETKAR